MNEDNNNGNLFTHGATWLRADFHLHTRADKEFIYRGEENRFISDYVDGLKAAGIQLGVITNHNKFDWNEFKALRRKAGRDQICLLPGVELSVNDGANGVHVLIVFSDEWLEKGNDYISPFITSMYPNKAESEYQNENGRTMKNILQVVGELEQTTRDYFMIFAHVEQKNGLWREMAGGRLSDFKSKTYRSVCLHTLGFQKVRSRDDRLKVKQCLGEWYPAEVEGSDCKSIEEIGRGKPCFLKIGAFSFDAVKYALTDYSNRIGIQPISHSNSHIKSIRFEGGTLDGKDIYFSPEMTTLIGIRGSGKSSILEVLRYVLGIPFGDKASDREYKENLVQFTMGSGGKVIIEAVDRFGQAYEIRRVLREATSEVYMDSTLYPGVSIRETVIHKPIYFGQKDLSNSGEGFEKDLVEKLLGIKLDGIRREIDQQKQVVAETVDRLTKMANVHESIDEQIGRKQDTEHKLKFYQDHGVEEKLQKQLDFDNDIRIMKKGVELADSFMVDLRELIAKYEDDIRNFLGHTSKRNPNLFEEFYEDFDTLVQGIDNLNQVLAKVEITKERLSAHRRKLNEIRKSLSDEFAGIERKLAGELKSGGAQNINLEEFLNLKKTLSSALQLLEELHQQGDKKQKYEENLTIELQKLNSLYHREFLIIKQELDKVGENNDALSIEVGYKEDKSAFLDFMKQVFRGSGVKETTFLAIVNKYQDFIDIYKDLDRAKNLFGSNPQKLTDLIFDSLKTLLNYQVPNKFTILYRGKELQQHSLGQRASALMIFILTQQENDVIIIDQPEDDLDNQTIYEDVIKLIRQIKHDVQFIFATHNPNIPVLGDAEQVHACKFELDKVQVQSGSVDNEKIQKIIVDIMEGGQEAFNRRKEIYQIWKP